MSAVGLHLLAVGVEEALEGEGSVSVVPGEVFTSLGGGTGLLAGLDKDISDILPTFGNCNLYEPLRH